MTCCGNIIEVTEQEDRIRQYFCQECGKQGPASLFAEPDEAGTPPTRRVRLAIAGMLGALADWVAPK